VRFVFTPPADHAAGLLTLPWSVPLAQWRDDRLVEIRQRGISRHVVRFISEDGTLYALKELNERLARREYRLLRAMADLNIPAVEAIGIAVDLGETEPRQQDSDAILVTKFLSFSTTYRAVFSHPRGVQPIDGLLDALAELLVRLHLSGFFWGDCSLSNALFVYDAGTLEAYLVDAETSEQHPALTDGQRKYDIELAIERVAGELLDLQSGGLLSFDIDPVEIADELGKRYESLWQELTREEILRPEDQRRQIAERLHRLNKLGFDADEVELIPTPEGNKLRVRTRVAETGHFAQQLFLRTGIDAGENQARRLLNDIAGFRAYLEQIFAGLRDAGLDVFHVVLDGDDEVLRQRIQGSAEAQAWRLDHLAEYRSSRAWMIQAADLAVDTGRRTPTEIAHQIAAALPEPMRTDTP